MTQEEKDLLFKDLCARLPYGVKYIRNSWNYEWNQELSVIEILEDIDKDGYINNTKVYSVEDIKPFLFPLSSMTMEQWEEAPKGKLITNFTFSKLKSGDFILDSFRYDNDLHILLDFIQWLIKNHFDIYGLIPKGLAIDATDRNIYLLNTKNKIDNAIIIHKGEYFKCIRELDFQRGARPFEIAMIYKSHKDGCITDKYKRDYVFFKDDWQHYFLRI